MPGKLDDPKHWLNLAEEARTIAEALHDPYSKRTMLLIAQGYATMAERAKTRFAEPTRLKTA